MNFSCIKISVMNRLEFTITNSLENLSEVNNFKEIDQKETYKLSGLEDEQGNIYFNPLINNFGSGIFLKEEETYFILIEQSNIFDKNTLFQNSFFNSFISYYENAEFINKIKVYPYRAIGYFNTKNYVGILDISTEMLPMFIEVESKKLNFQTEYITILNDISNTMIELALRFGSVNQINVEYSSIQSKTNFMESLHLQHLIESFIQSLDQVVAMPYVTTEEFLEIVNFGTSSEIDVNDLLGNFQNYEWVAGGPLQQNFRGFSPLKINNLQRINTYDNYPNKFVKHVGMYILYLLMEIENSIQTKRTLSGFDKIRLKQIAGWIDKIQTLLYTSFFVEVGELNIWDTKSQVLEKRINYQEVYNIYEKLQLAIELNLSNPINNSDNYFSKPVSDLYEVWCFLEIEKIIHSLLSNDEKSDFPKINDGIATLSLKQGERSVIRYSRGKKKINLYYNKLFSQPSSYSLNYKPDITIETVEEEKIEYHHFDAKYKLGSNESYKEEDIWKMHAYKDGIIYSLGATILYPGNKSDHFFNGEKYIKVIPMNPDAASKLELAAWIKLILKI